jgi:hypothetical protein
VAQRLAQRMQPGFDPLSPEANDVLPPVLGELARYRDGQSPPGATLWLGNLYQSGRSS